MCNRCVFAVFGGVYSGVFGCIRVYSGLCAPAPKNRLRCAGSNSIRISHGSALVGFCGAIAQGVSKWYQFVLYNTREMQKGLGGVAAVAAPGVGCGGGCATILEF